MPEKDLLLLTQTICINQGKQIVGGESVSELDQISLYGLQDNIWPAKESDRLFGACPSDARAKPLFRCSPVS